MVYGIQIHVTLFTSYWFYITDAAMASRDVIHSTADPDIIIPLLYTQKISTQPVVVVLLISSLYPVVVSSWYFLVVTEVEGICGDAESVASQKT